ncbi:nitronate monooxygenase family protein [Lachnospiraceae bacterium ZAX-1]
MGVGVSLSNLAGHVARCGGVGIISAAQIGYQEDGFDSRPIETNQKALEKHIKKAKELARGGGIIGVNIMVATKRYEEYVKTAVKAGVDLIISGAGLPINLPALVEKSKTKIAPIVSSVKSALVICKLWDRKFHRAPDLVVIEGPKAGGHLGFTYEQLKQEEDSLGFEKEIQGILVVVDGFRKKYDYKIPVVIAGGIYDKQDMQHYLDLGADGVQVATRFVTTYECDADERYKQAYLKAKQADIQIVKSPVGMPGRAIHNAFIDKTEKGLARSVVKCHQCLELCKQKDIPYCITDALVNAVKGNIEEGLLFCGANAYRAKSLEHVEDIMWEFAR